MHNNSEESITAPTLGLKFEPKDSASPPIIRMKSQSIEPEASVEEVPSAIENIEDDTIISIDVPTSEPVESEEDTEIQIEESIETPSHVVHHVGNRPVIDRAEHRVPVQSASIPYNTVAEKQPRSLLGKATTIDYAEHRVPVQSASLPANLSEEDRLQMIRESEVELEQYMTPTSVIAPPTLPSDTMMARVANIEEDRPLPPPVIIEESMPESVTATAPCAPAEEETQFTLDEVELEDTSCASLVLDENTPLKEESVVQPMTQTTVERVMRSLSVSQNSTIGQMLRSARESANVSLHDVRAYTSIREDYLTALENDQIDALPERVYVLGYIRTLCAFYRLDNTYTQMVIDRFNGSSAPKEVKMVDDNDVPRPTWITIKPVHIMTAFVALVVGMIGLTLFLIFGQDISISSNDTNVDLKVNPTVSTSQEAPVDATEKIFKTSDFKLLYPQFQAINLSEVPEKRL